MKKYDAPSLEVKETVIDSLMMDESMDVDIDVGEGDE